MKTTRINEIVIETLRKGGLEKFPLAAQDWLVQDIEEKLEADAAKRIRKFITPALIAKAVGQAYSKRTRAVEAPAAAKSGPVAGIPPLPTSTELR